MVEDRGAGNRAHWGQYFKVLSVRLFAFFCLTASATADNDELLWQQMYPEQLARFQDYARLVINADADHQGDLLKLWGQRKLPLTIYGIGLDDNDPSGATAALVWTAGEFKGGPEGQLNGATAIDFDLNWQPVKSAPTIDAAVPSIDLYVSNDALPDLTKVEVLHESGLQRDVVHRGYGCQMARWVRGGEIVKVVGTVRMGAEEGAPVYDTTYGGPTSEGLTTKGLEGLCASRIVMFGLGLNFVDVAFTELHGESIMMDGGPRRFAEPSPYTDQPLIELLYRSKLKPGSTRADAIALIDGLKADR